MSSTVPNGLTEKQQRFAREYLKDLNATAAYKRAGYTVSQGAAEASACRLLGNAKVQNAIRTLMAERCETTKVTTERVVEELALIAFAPKDEVKDRDRIRALELLGKHTGGFADRINLTEERKRVPYERVVIEPAEPSQNGHKTDDQE